MFKGMKYILDGKTAIPCEDVIEWSNWFEHADRIVDRDEMDGGKIVVSTVFIGLDTTIFSAAPLYCLKP